MNYKGYVKKISLFILISLIVLSVSSCKKKNGNDDKTVYYDNESDALTFSSQELDKVFNPFFSTSASDGNVVGFTQIGMLGNDKDGKVTYGDSEAVVTKDLEIISEGSGDDETTTYYFVLKNNVKFSNGSALTIKDVLFNLYVYLDPVYTGSSTIYSTDIVGLKEYRTQQASETEQDSFKLQFQIQAEARITALVEACGEILDDHRDENLDSDKICRYLEEYTTISNTYKYVVEDYKKAVELFGEELESDYSNSIDSYEDVTFSDEKGNVYKNLFTTDVEVFLYNEGYISWSKKEAKLSSSLVNNPSDLKSWTKEKAISTILADKIPYAIEEVVMYWNTSVTLNDYLVNSSMEEYFQNSGDRKYQNISGIKFANREESITVNGVTYKVPQYENDGAVKDGFNEVLSIKIKGVDPKAIWNFAFSVAPMYYYSDQEHIAKFDYVANFGVEYASPTFMTGVVANPDKNAVPVGAGAYAASKSSGGIENISGSDFYNLGIVYYERNPYYVMGPAKIKKIRLKVIAANQMLNSLYAGEIDFVEPNAKPETIKKLNEKVSEGIGNKSIRTSGYGYIGINAGKVPDLAVRQAIMHSIDTQECVDYYKSTASAIYRPMSLSSWAYPKGATSYYPYVGGPVPKDLSLVNPAYAEYVTSLGKKSGDYLSEAEQHAFLKGLVESAGYTLNANGIYVKGSHKLEYKFTIAGEETDHPAWKALWHSGEMLNKIGFAITVSTDSNALKKLSSGLLTVWAAAWGSTIDPDMYQVYHKESSATSVLNWGYKQILQNVGGKYDTEKLLVEELSELIDDARKITDETKRARIYSQALDIVMQLAVELPTYQRNDLFAYNTNKIDVSTLTQDSELSPYKGLTSDLYKVSLNVER